MTDQSPLPEVSHLTEAEVSMLRRAASACRNITLQVTGDAEWFSWVPRYLELLAERASGSDEIPPPS